MLDRIDLDRFRRDGFVKGPRVLGDGELEELRAELDRVIAQRGLPGVAQPGGIADIGKPGQPLWQIVNIYLASDAFRRLLNLDGLGAAAAAMIGGDEIRVWHDQIQYKPKGVGASNHWHQDWPYWPKMARPDAVTAWIAIDDADIDNGCMRMVPGSHHWGKAIDFLHCVGELDNMPKQYQEHRVEVRMCPVRAGEVHFHHSLTWHASHGNTSQRPRRAIALHLMNQEALVDGGHGIGTSQPNQRQPLLWRAGRQVDVPPVAVAQPAGA
jgi:hypothetical protein